MTLHSTILSEGTQVQLVAAFTRDGAGGNLAGVVLDELGLPTTERQRIATAVAASETAFVCDLGDAVFDVTFFTPAVQVPDCGHATVATFALLAQNGALKSGRAVKRTMIGDRAITIEGERVFMEQPRPQARPFRRVAEVAGALSIAPETLVGEPVVADHGVRFVLVETSREALASIVPHDDAIVALSAEADAYGFYVYARDAGRYDATIRMFAPAIGIPEEPATGMAAGLLGGYLARGAEHADYRFEQGALSPKPSPSELIVRVGPNTIHVGGTATIVRTLHV